MIQIELFEPEPLPAVGREEMDFSLTLKDGSNVSVHFERHFTSNGSHLEFFSVATSETGYHSYFPYDGDFINDPDDAVVEKAKEVAEFFRDKTLGEIAKESRRRKPKTTELKQ